MSLNSIKITKVINEVKSFKGRLDISIKSADKVLTSENKIKQFLNIDLEVEQKTDGVKITLLRNNEPYDRDNFSKNYIVAYKGSILYDSEFDHISIEDIKKSSIGASQFKILIEHFKKIHKKGDLFDKGVELFIEYLMKKPTLSTKYQKYHNMVLIGYSKSDYKIKNGKLITYPKRFEIYNRDKIAKFLEIDTPNILFDGVLGNKETFQKSIKSKDLLNLYLQRKNNLEWENPKNLLNQLKQMFLDVKSVYGGLEEGVILIPKKFKFPILKWQQDYQLDKEYRKQIKLQYIADEETENKYWQDIREIALSILKEVNFKQDLDKILKQISLKLKDYKINIKHPKKNIVNIKDDIQLTSKLIAIRKLKGNNGALIVGKFRILTKAHYDMINKALKEFDTVNIALVSSKDNKHTKEIRKKMIESCFKNKINLIETTSGNLITIINRFQDNINYIIAGTDRVQTYKNQLKRMPDVNVKEIKRNENDISATKVIERLKDFEYFKTNTPICIHKFYEELKDIYL